MRACGAAAALALTLALCLVVAAHSADADAARRERAVAGGLSELDQAPAPAAAAAASAATEESDEDEGSESAAAAASKDEAGGTLSGASKDAGSSGNPASMSASEAGSESGSGSEAAAASSEDDMIDLMRQLAAGRGQKIAGGVVTFVMDNKNKMMSNRKEREQDIKTVEEQSAKRREKRHVEVLEEEKTKLLSEHKAKEEAWAMEKNVFNAKHENVLANLNARSATVKKQWGEELEKRLARASLVVREAVTAVSNQKEDNARQRQQGEEALAAADRQARQVIDNTVRRLQQQFEQVRDARNAALARLRETTKQQVDNAQRAIDKSKDGAEEAVRQAQKQADAAVADATEERDKTIKEIEDNRKILRDAHAALAAAKRRKLRGKTCNCEDVTLGTEQQAQTRMQQLRWQQRRVLRNQWLNCPDGKFLVGLERSQVDNLNGLLSMRCCAACKDDGQTQMQATGCESANWVHSFDREGFSSCPAGKYLAGLYRSTCEHIYCLEYARCCALAGSRGPTSVREEAAWSGSFNSKGWSAIEENRLMIALHRSNSHRLSSIDSPRTSEFFAYDNDGN